MSGRGQGFSFLEFFSSLTMKKAILLLYIVGFIVFANSLFNEFVWDDLIQIVSNKAIHSIDLTQFFSGLNYNPGSATSFIYPYYRPLFVSALSLLYSLFTEKVFFYHLIQLIFHIANASLLYILFKKFFNNRLAFLLSLIFLIHPINTESVVYVSAIGETLFLFFGLLGFIVLNKDELNYKRLLLGFLSLLFSVFSKETGVLFIFAVILNRFLFKKSGNLKVIFSGALVSGVYLFLRLAVAEVFLAKASDYPIMAASFIDRVRTMPAIFFYYIKTFFYPKALAISQHWVVRSADLKSFYLPLLLDLLFIAALIYFGTYLWRNKNELLRPYLFFGCIFFLGMGLHLQIFPLDMTVADRWFYFTIIGLLGIVGVFASILKIEKLSNFPKSTVFAFVAVVVVLLSIRTTVRNSNWKSPLALYSHDAQYNNTAFDLELNLGVELFKAGKSSEAKEHFEQSVALAPNHWTNWHNLASYYFTQRDYDKAGEYYQIAIKNNPLYLKAYENYGNLLISKGDYEKAKDFLGNSVEKFPKESSILWLYLAISSYKLNFPEEALDAARKAYQLAQNKETQYVYYNLSRGLPLKIE